jgi:MFS family permease
MESINSRGYTAVLKNRNFLALWMAQVLSNTALTGSFFLQLILIEQVTGSSGHLAAVILSFSLPAVLLSALAGIVVDRVPKKVILISSNALRVVMGAALAFLASYILTHNLNEWLFLLAIYVLVFVISAIGQFFAPAEGATIPLLVSTDNLLPANSLFTLTVTSSQILGMVILAPLGVKTIGLSGSLWVAVAMYVGATVCVAIIPRDHIQRKPIIDGLSALRRAFEEIREGWAFAVSHRAIIMSLLQLALVSTLTMIMAELAPGFATRVLGLQPEDATYIFWPAGVGMLAASIMIGRFGHQVPREILASMGMMIMGMAMLGLAWAGNGSVIFGQPLFKAYPELVITTAAAVMAFALLTGVSMATIQIPAQTILQERAHHEVRGRVMAVQFTLSNALGIPPLLFAGTFADRYGIPRVTLAIGIFIILLAFINIAVVRSMSHLPHSRKHARDHPPLASHPPDTSSKEP